MGRPKKTIKDYEREAIKAGACLISKHGIARKIYQMRHGKLPRHIYVCHKCDNGLCIRDSHHFPGTQKENVHDSIRKNRMANAAWKKAVSKRAKRQHAEGRLGQITWSRETKTAVYKKIGDVLRGRVGPTLGQKRTVAQRRRYRVAALQRSADPNYIKKISGKNHWNYGGPGTMLGRKWKKDSPGRKKLSRLMHARNQARRKKT